LGAVLSLLFALILAGVPGCFAQSRQQISEQTFEIDDLVNEGEYEHAAQLAKLLFEELKMWGRDEHSVLSLAYIGKAQTELGHLGDAVNTLGLADALSSSLGTTYYDATLRRETAALYYALAGYHEAAAGAAKAVRLSQERNSPKIRVAYCKSIEALALLRIGKLSEAELLAASAVKECPKKPGRSPLFAPRILYAACVVESHAGNFADAEAYCRRGLDIASQSKRETRDLSLGYLALAEAQLEAGDLAQSREAATQGRDLTVKMFGEQHQDMVQALGLLAKVSAKEGNMTHACANASRAVKLAAALFGERSPGAAGPIRALREMDACR
jgi:tetratricopeptide (TPR) repeat protein